MCNQRKCKTCGGVYYNTNLKVKYCSLKCRKIVYNISRQIEPYHKSCKYCNKEFDTICTRSIYCTPNCRSKDYYAIRNYVRIVKCKSCNNEFEKKTSNKIYCSDECKINSLPKTKHNCLQCDKEYYADPKSKYCSVKCRRKYDNVKWRLLGYKACVRCKQRHNTSGRFCGSECRLEYVKSRVMVKCLLCDNKFAYRGSKKYCSSFCCKKHFKLINTI